MRSMKNTCTLLILVGACSALPQYSSQQQPQCASNQDCVPYKRCGADGYIITDGGGFINLKAHSTKKCSDPDNPSDPAICCNIRGAPDPSPTTCPDNKVCLPSHLCNDGGNGNTDGSGYIKLKSVNSQKCNHEHTSVAGICCTDPPHPAPITPTSPPSAAQCGVRNSEEFTSNVANNEAQFGEFPWQGAIFFKNFTFQCGASLIGDKWVVTAAHCVDGFKTYDINVRFGEWQVNNFEERLQYVDADVAAITIHPKFNPINAHNDIAVIKLTKVLDFQYHINPICLPSPGQTFLGKRCIATGWGKDALDGQYQHILKKVEIPIVEYHQCQSLLQKTVLGRHFMLDDSFMCAGGEENNDSCEGDGGGPLACEIPGTGRYVLTGITAWGLECGKKDEPGVYADVQKLLPFVQAVLDNNYDPNSFNQH